MINNKKNLIFQANAAGLAYQELYHNTWKTREFQTLLGKEEYSLRGFKGDYVIKVRNGDQILMKKQFVLSDGGSNIEIHLNGTAGMQHISDFNEATYT